MPLTPKPDLRGWFETVLGRPPTDWPWALPNLYAVNTALDAADEIAGARASPDGSSSVRYKYNADRSRVEIVGFWRGEFRVIHVEHASSPAKAEKQAADVFTSFPVRYLLHAGATVRENVAVHITGDWPERWQIQRYQDLGVLCAFIYEQAQKSGAADAAEDFRRSIQFAWPVTEQVMVYRSALQYALRSLSRWLSVEALNAIREALATIQRWFAEVGTH